MTGPATADLDIKDLMRLVVEENASDLHLRVGAPPMIRLHGALQGLDTAVLTAADTERLMLAITPPEHVERLHNSGGSDFGFGFGDLGRFRVSIFRQEGQVGVVMRLLPSRFMSLEEIGLPPQIYDLLDKARGLILVTGPTGSGKTTTLASMIHVINQRKHMHVLTVEDPIEYHHPHRNCLVTQREVGPDVPSFGEALRRGLRQDPDVMLVGEMRDLETMEAAITAAETGHLVFATLHTTGAAPTVDRIVGAFPTNQQEQVRMQLSASLVAVISQLLLPRVDRPGRVAVLEVMIATASVRALIRENKTYRIDSDIQTGAKHGMFSLDASLMKLYEEGLISYEDCISKARHPESVLEKMDVDSRRKR